MVFNYMIIFRTIGWVPGGFIAGFIYDGLAAHKPFDFITPLIILIVGLFVLTPLFYFLSNKPKNQLEKQSEASNE